MSLFHLSPFHYFLPLKPPSFHHHNTHRLLLPLRSTSTTITASSAKSLPQSAIIRIADKLRSLGFSEQPPATPATTSQTLTPGEIFVPSSKSIPKYRVGHTLDASWSTPENPVPEIGSGDAVLRMNELVGETKREREREARMRRKVDAPTIAELMIPASEIRRLTTVGVRMKRGVKVGKAGVTEGIVNGIHEWWRGQEVVKIACEDVWKLNMKRTHDLLESKTGGMVVWRAGSKIILYRGPNYKFPYFKLKEDRVGNNSLHEIMEDENLPSGEESNSADKDARPTESRVLAQSSLVRGVGSPNKVRLQLPGEKLMIEEADRLLDGLGPRFTDWWGYEPLPVDADLLPAVVPGLRRPFRLLPYGVKPKLTNDELTILKRLGRPLPCHFALGRNRNLQGLAAAMIKLWEKCEIAKIAIKRGVQNTNSEKMAEELKRLTGGVMLSRDKDYIVFYRGKDFLPFSVSSAIEERRRVRMQRDKEQLEADSTSIVPEHSNGKPTLSQLSGENGATNVPKESNDSDEKRRLKNNEADFERTNMKLSMALEKKERAEKLLAELEQKEIAQQAEIDKEGLAEEERYMLRKVGLKMQPFLLLGRRGVFDGTVENMHLHWKYRELVKIICGEKNIEEVHKIAQILEAESGGILVAVERVRNGYAIIVYRGKNYQRPASLRPETLLNKKEAMRRSLEAQRRRSLKLHVLKLSKNVEELLFALEKDKKKSDNSFNSDSEVEQQNQIDEPVDDFSHASSTDSVESSAIHPTHEMEPTILGKSDVKLESVVSDNDWESDSDSEEEGPVSLYKKAPKQEIESDSESRKMPSAPLSNKETLNSLNEWESDSDSEEEGLMSSYKTSPKKEMDSDSESSKIHPVPLSNKERLILRKHALKMKRCPLLSLGRGNALAGVAKAIKDHFKKYPLIIVNVKGRAKGTSVQEVIFELQKATGALLVSQEPSKVILYRGWGVNLRAGSAENFKDDSFKRQNTQPTVSPELLAAMRIECGLSSNSK